VIHLPARFAPNIQKAGKIGIMIAARRDGLGPIEKTTGAKRLQIGRVDAERTSEGAGLPGDGRPDHRRLDRAGAQAAQQPPPRLAREIALPADLHPNRLILRGAHSLIVSI